jgi:hypothetical protein
MASLRLRRSAAGPLCEFVAEESQTFNARSLERAQKSCAFPLTITYMDVAYPSVTAEQDYSLDEGCGGGVE